MGARAAYFLFIYLFLQPTLLILGHQKQVVKRTGSLTAGLEVILLSVL